MLVSEAVLRTEATFALRNWWRLVPIARTAGAPVMLVLAHGSVETNLNPVYTRGTTGDGGHGHGLLQLDDRWHSPPFPLTWYLFDRTPRAQFRVASTMIAANIKAFAGASPPSVRMWAAAAAYNCGVGGASNGIQNHGGNPDYETTKLGTAQVGYGAEVIARYGWLQANMGIPGWWNRPLRLASVGRDVLSVKARLRAAGAPRSMAMSNLVLGSAAAFNIRWFQGHRGLPVTGVVDAIVAHALG